MKIHKINIYLLVHILFLFSYINCSSVNLEPINNNNYNKNNNTNEVNNNSQNNSNNEVTEDNSDNSNNEVTEELNDDNDSENDIYIDQYPSDILENELRPKDDTYYKLSDAELLYKDFIDYYKSDVCKISLYKNVEYHNREIIKIEKENDFYMYFPYDIKVNNNSSDNDWDLIWDNKYDDYDISVQFISIDRDIPKEADNEYINSLFFGFISNPEFKEKLGIKKWKPHIDENLIRTLAKKNIKVSVIKSGAKHYPLDKVNFINYFVITLYNPQNRKLVFLLNIYKFNKSVYNKMINENILDNYYNNWMAFISSFNFL